MNGDRVGVSVSRWKQTGNRRPDAGNVRERCADEAKIAKVGIIIAGQMFIMSVYGAVPCRAGRKFPKRNGGKPAAA